MFIISSWFCLLLLIWLILKLWNNFWNQQTSLNTTLHANVRKCKIFVRSSTCNKRTQRNVCAFQYKNFKFLWYKYYSIVPGAFVENLMHLISFSLDSFFYMFFEILISKRGASEWFCLPLLQSIETTVYSL